TSDADFGPGRVDADLPAAGENGPGQPFPVGGGERMRDGACTVEAQRRLFEHSAFVEEDCDGAFLVAGGKNRGGGAVVFDPEPEPLNQVAAAMSEKRPGLVAQLIPVGALGN